MPLIGVWSQEEAYIEATAPVAYEFCVARFGEPVDPSIPYQICRDLKYSASAYASRMRCYLINIGSEYRHHEQLCASLGHEMYHRVTMRIGGAHKEPWLNEALGYAAGQWFMRHQGYEDVADYNDNYRVTHTNRPELWRLRRTRKTNNPWARLRGRLYPPGFDAQAQVFAIELQRIVTTEQFAAIVGATSFESWSSKLSFWQSARVDTLISRN